MAARIFLLYLCAALHRRTAPGLPMLATHAPPVLRAPCVLQTLKQYLELSNKIQGSPPCSEPEILGLEVRVLCTLHA